MLITLSSGKNNVMVIILFFFAHLHTVNSTTLILCSEASTEMLINWRISIVVIFGPNLIKNNTINTILLLNILFKIQCCADINIHRFTVMGRIKHLKKHLFTSVLDGSFLCTKCFK